jgi:hypothetical protein
LNRVRRRFPRYGQSSEDQKPCLVRLHRGAVSVEGG